MQMADAVLTQDTWSDCTAIPSSYHPRQFALHSNRPRARARNLSSGVGSCHYVALYLPD
jgi:hypothetical protein